MSNNITGGVKDALGIAGAGKYLYQAGRAAQGLSTGTKLTTALDLASGTFGLSTASTAQAAIKSTSTIAKGITGAGKLTTASGAVSSVSTLGKAASFATKAAPIVAKGSAALGVVLGGIEIGQGIHELNNGNAEKGKEKIVSGAADTITSVALGVAATSGASVVGVPVAAVALGVAGVAQAGKYAYKYKDEIAAGAQFVGGKIADGAQFVGGKIADGAKAVGGAVVDGAKAVGNGAKAVGGAVADGAQFVGGKIVDGAKAAGGAVVNGARAVGGAVSDFASDAGNFLSSKFQALKGAFS